jgi:hypothetical protein
MPIQCKYCLEEEFDDDIEVHMCNGHGISCWTKVCDECCWSSSGRIICPNCHIENKSGKKECVACGGQGDVFLTDDKDNSCQGPGLKAYRSPVGFIQCDLCDGTGKTLPEYLHL